VCETDKAQIQQEETFNGNSETVDFLNSNFIPGIKDSGDLEQSYAKEILETHSIRMALQENNDEKSFFFLKR
jgi:hypothetical protein